MRDIHPEILARSYDPKSVAALQWEATKECVDWNERVNTYLLWISENLQTLISVNAEAFTDFFAEALVPPFKALVAKSKYPNSYHMLTRMDEYSDLCIALTQVLSGNLYKNPHIDQELLCNVQTHNISLYSWMMWELSKKKTYTVAAQLTEGLKATKLSGYQADSLRSPFPAIYIEFPKGAFEFTAYSDNVTPSDTGYVTLPVEGAYILEDTTPVGMRLWRVVVICQYHDKPSGQVQLNHYYIPLYEGASVEDCLADSIEMMKGIKSCKVTVLGEGEGKIGSDSGCNRGWDDRIVNCARDIFKYLMNVVIYVTRSDADITFSHASEEYERFKARMLAAQGKKREELKHRMRRMNNNTRRVVGKSYTIKRWDEKTAAQYSEGGRHLTVRSLVSGHWRNQVCGAGGLDRKTIWIEPFWRGPEAAPLTEKRAVVK